MTVIKIKSFRINVNAITSVNYREPTDRKGAYCEVTTTGMNMDNGQRFVFTGQDATDFVACYDSLTDQYEAGVEDFPRW